MRQIFATFLIVLVSASMAQDVVVKDSTATKKKKHRRDTSAILHQPLRLEIPVADFRDDFEIVEGNPDGLLVVQNTHEYINNSELWHMHMVNKELEVDWEIDQLIPDNSDLIAYDYSIGFYFLLFDSPRRYRDYKALVIDVRGEKTLVHDFEVPFDMELHFFEALDNGVLMVGRHNNRPVALIYDLVSHKPIILPGFYNHNEHVFDLVMDEPNRAFSIVLAEKMRNGKYTNRIKTFTYDGLLVVENLIHPGEELNLIDGTTTRFGSGIQYMVGTYSWKQSDYSRGIYISKFVNGQQRFIVEHNYGDFNNFFSYRGERAARRIARKVERKKERGREPKFNYKLFIHYVIPRGDLNILVAEAYYPRYATNSSSYMSSFGGTPYYNFNRNGGMYGPIQAFLGYKFTHAIIVAFDANGKIVWDNSFRTNDITSYNLIESVAANIQGDKAIISYLDDNKIKSKVIEGNEVLEGKTYNPVKLLTPGDKLVGGDSEIKGVRNWYDNFLFSYGLQRIRNRNLPQAERRRRVFYINKLEFETSVENEKKFPITFDKKKSANEGTSIAD